MALFADMRTATGFCVPVNAPLQPEKRNPAAGVADRLATLHDTHVADDGAETTVPPPKVAKLKE